MKQRESPVSGGSGGGFAGGNRRVRGGLWFGAAGGVGVGVLLGWLFFWGFPGDDSLRRLRLAGVIRIGYAVEAPYAFLTEDGVVTGESPEVARVVVSRLGIGRVEWRQSEFGALLGELESGRIDVIAAGMFITEERARRVRFSVPTFHVGQGLLVGKGNPRGLHSYKQAVGLEGVRIAVLAGSVEERMLRGLGISSGRLLVVPDVLTGWVAVESGVADGLALSSPTVRWMALDNQLGRTEMAEPFEQLAGVKGGVGGFAFRRGDRRLATAWDGVLAGYIGSAEHVSLIRGFGFTGDDLPVRGARSEGREQ